MTHLTKIALQKRALISGLAKIPGRMIGGAAFGGTAGYFAGPENNRNQAALHGALAGAIAGPAKRLLPVGEILPIATGAGLLAGAGTKESGPMAGMINKFQ